ncbi:MAG: hypothetical protein IPN80_13100 [Flavobacterium sp.]|nr:hypothetical protein [Flavobacterium sp.]
MKKSIIIPALLAFLFVMNVNAQEEPKQQKKEKVKKECNVNGKKCCAGGEKKGCASEATEKKSGHCDAKKEM